MFCRIIIFLCFTLSSLSTYGCYQPYERKRDSLFSSVLRPAVGWACFTYGGGGVMVRLIDAYLNRTFNSSSLLTPVGLLLASGIFLRVQDVRHWKKYQHRKVLVEMVGLPILAALAGIAVGSIVRNQVEQISWLKGSLLQKIIGKRHDSFELIRLSLLTTWLVTAYYNAYALANYYLEKGRLKVWSSGGNKFYGHDFFIYRDDIKNKIKLKDYFESKSKDSIIIHVPLAKNQVQLTDKQLRERTQKLVGSIQHKHVVAFLGQHLPYEMIMKIFSYVDSISIKVPAFLKSVALKSAPQEIKDYYDRIVREGTPQQKNMINSYLIVPWKASIEDDAVLMVDLQSLKSSLESFDPHICQHRRKHSRLQLYQLIKAFLKEEKKENLYKVTMLYSIFKNRLDEVNREYKQTSSLIRYFFNTVCGKNKKLAQLNQVANEKERSLPPHIELSATTLLPLNTYYDKCFYFAKEDI